MNRISKQRQRRQLRIRSKITGTKIKPRLSVFRSNKHIYIQLIDDINGKTILAVSDKNFSSKGNKTEIAYNLGMEVAKLASTKKIKNGVFDKGSYAYHGRVKAIAEGARKGGFNL
jgi:large subunit ribosomal protein L18